MKRRQAVMANRVFLLSVLCAELFTIAIALCLRATDSVNEFSVFLLQFLSELFLVLPAAVYLILQKKSLKESVGLCKISGKQFLLLIPVAVCVDKIAEFFNLFSQLFTTNEIGGYVMKMVVDYPLFFVFFVIAVEPAICEELVYRGVVYQGYRRGRILVAAVVSAFLFGMMHMNLNQFIYAFAIGFIFAIVNEALGSILPSMLIHVYINGKSIVLVYAVVRYVNEIRKRYLAAELAGDLSLMENLKELAPGIPIESADWLGEYLNQSADVKALLPEAAFWMVISIIALFFLIRLLARSAGRERHLRDIFTFGGRKQALGRESVLENGIMTGDAGDTVTFLYEDGAERVSGQGETARLTQAGTLDGHLEKKESPLYFITPSLIFGLLVCIWFMIFK